MVPARARRASAVPATPAVAAIQRVGVECRLAVIARLLEGPKRFHELQTIGEGVEGRTLSRVLRYLVAEGIVRRNVVKTHPFAVQYALTEKGEQLRPVVDSLAAWGSRWTLPDDHD